MTRIGLFGGTFNPPHLGHMDAARAAVDALELDKLIFMPAGTPPHKTLDRNSPDALARLEMTRLAALDFSGATVSDAEVRRQGKSYTADTVRELLAEQPDTELWLIMGGDMFMSLERWYDSAWLLQNVGVAVFARADEEAAIDSQARELEARGSSVKFVQKDIIEISSTELRSLLPERGGREYLADSVYSYIIKNRLYGALPSLDWLREKAVALLKPSRVPHVLGTEETAAKMALLWGADVEDARTAALLHDCTKRLDQQEQLKFAGQCGTMSDISSGTPEKLLHAITGAELARREFGVSDAIRDAIRWHTTGRPNMTLLEKIIYLADMVEPNRDFDGVEHLRTLCFSNIDEAMLKSLEYSIDSVRRRGLPEDDTTLRALEFYRGIKNEIIW